MVDFTRGGPDRQLYYAEAKSIFNENGYNYTGEDANGSNLKALNGKAMPLPEQTWGGQLPITSCSNWLSAMALKPYATGQLHVVCSCEAQQIGMNVPIGIPSMGGETYYKVKLANGKEIPNWMTVMKPSALKFLTKEEVAKWNITSANSFNEWMKILPSAQEIASWAWAGRAKRGWYRYTNKVFNSVFGSDTHRVSLLMAALSPQCGVEINVENTMRVWTAWLKDTENRNNLIKDLESKGEKFWWVENT